MTISHEQTERFLRGVKPPEYQSNEHRRQLREQVLARLQARQSHAGIGRGWKTAALLLGLVAAGAVATEVIIQVRHYYFYGRAKDGFYYFSTTPENAETNQVDSIGICVGGDLDAAGIEQKRKDLGEIDALRQRNARELFRVIDNEKNGKPVGRIFCYKYVLADKRTEIITETGEESLSPAQKESDRRQIADLRERGQREILNVVQVEVGGRIQRHLTCHYVLSDRRGVIRSEPDPELPGPVPLTFKQQMELDRLAVLEKKGKFLGSTQVQVLRRTFSLQRYSFTLSDGTVVKRSEGQPEGPKNNLTAADGDEVPPVGRGEQG